MAGDLKMETEKLQKAVLWEAETGKEVHCYLCSFRCKIPEGHFGHCGVRKNIDGTPYSLNYDKV